MLTGDGTDEDPIRTVAPVNDCLQCRSRPGGVIRVKDGKCIECGREYPLKTVTNDPDKQDRIDADCFIDTYFFKCDVKMGDALVNLLRRRRLDREGSVLAERDRCAKISENHHETRTYGQRDTESPDKGAILGKGLIEFMGREIAHQIREGE